jgi:hypothetical protein
MIGQVDFDLFVRNNTTKNCLQVKKYCVNFKKDLTPEMFAAQLATMLEIADLLSEDPQKIIIYMGVVIGYTIIEIGIEIALIVLQICDICTIASLIPIIFVG